MGSGSETNVIFRPKTHVHTEVKKLKTYWIHKEFWLDQFVATQNFDPLQECNLTSNYFLLPFSVKYLIVTFIEFLKNCNVVDTIDVLLKVNEAYNNNSEEGLKSELDSTSLLFQNAPLTSVEVMKFFKFMSISKGNIS